MSVSCGTAFVVSVNNTSVLALSMCVRAPDSGVGRNGGVWREALPARRVEITSKTACGWHGRRAAVRRRWESCTPRRMEVPADATRGRDG